MSTAARQLGQNRKCLCSHRWLPIAPKATAEPRGAHSLFRCQGRPRQRLSCVPKVADFTGFDHSGTGLPHTFTLECNYNTGRIVNRIAHPHATEVEGGRGASLSPQVRDCLAPTRPPLGPGSEGLSYAHLGPSSEPSLA